MLPVDLFNSIVPFWDLKNKFYNGIQQSLLLHGVK